MNHGLPYSSSHMKIKYGDYDECSNADIIVICAGANQKEGQTRLDLVKINTNIIKSICLNIKESGFDGIIVVASNPVDILSYVVYKVTGFDHHKIIGTGTMLDTARMRYLLSEFLNISTNDIHAYILGEHGDSSFISWTNCYIGCKTLLSYIDEKGYNMDDLADIYEEVRNVAYDIISKKKATYYGIGLALNRLIQSIFNDEHTILCVSAYQNNEYNVSDMYIGTPCIIGRNGIIEIIKLPLNNVDQNKFEHSYKVLKETEESIKKEISN